jgi:polysaccharide export outer membrane protein
VWGHPELSGKFTIGDDGILSFPLVGQLTVAGRVASEVETELTTRLADGFLKDPRVSIEIQQYLSQRIFVIGEVRSPGPIPLTGAMTLLEALARAGSLTEQAGGEVVVLRPAADRVADGSGPLAPGQNGATELGRTSVQELRSGKLAANLVLRDGDTIFIPRSEPFFMLGQVRNPGAYTAQSGLTILRAISMAGGTTSLGSTGKIRIVRIVDGVKKEFKAKLDDGVKAGDTIFVGTRLF